jgi:hypothetical protein
MIDSKRNNEMRKNKDKRREKIYFFFVRISIILTLFSMIFRVRERTNIFYNKIND